MVKKTPKTKLAATGEFVVGSVTKRKSTRTGAATLTADLAPATTPESLDFEIFRSAVATQWKSRAKDLPVFTVETDKLWDTYLSSFNHIKGARQQHNCRACRKFIEKFGGLVQVQPDGSLVSRIWPTEAGAYSKISQNLKAKVEQRPIHGKFTSPDFWLGSDQEGEWTHFLLHNSGSGNTFHRLPSEEVRHASKEAFDRVYSTMPEISFLPALEAIPRLLSFNYPNVGGVLAQVRFFVKVQEVYPTQWILSADKGRKNRLWALLDTYPEPFTHIRSSLAWQYLQDAKNLGWSKASENLYKRLDPLAYQRRQAPPKLGNVVAADAFFVKSGLDKSLQRRQAGLGEYIALVQRLAPEKLHTFRAVEVPVQASPALQVFKAPQQHHPRLLARESNLGDMSWQHFRRRWAWDVTELKLSLLKHDEALPHFCQLLTAADPSAPPLFRYDSGNNPFHWFLLQGKQSLLQWGLHGVPVSIKVLCSAPLPINLSDDPYPAGDVLFLEGLRETSCSQTPLFPQILRADLRPYYSTIEEHGKTIPPFPLPSQTQAAAGVLLSSQGPFPTLRFQGVVAGQPFVATVRSWD